MARRRQWRARRNSLLSLETFMDANRTAFMRRLRGDEELYNEMWAEMLGRSAVWEETEWDEEGDPVFSAQVWKNLAGSVLQDIIQAKQAEAGWGATEDVLSGTRRTVGLEEALHLASDEGTADTRALGRLVVEKRWARVLPYLLEAPLDRKKMAFYLLRYNEVSSLAQTLSDSPDTQQAAIGAALNQEIEKSLAYLASRIGGVHMLDRRRTRTGFDLRGTSLGRYSWASLRYRIEQYGG